MAVLAGKSVVVAASTNDSTYNTVGSMNDVTMSFSGDNQDTTVFGDAFIERIQGLKDVSWSLGGFYDPTDTNGQVAIRSAWLNDTAIYIRVFPNGTAGFKQQVRVSSFEVSAGVDGTVEVSIELEGTGTVTAV